MYSRFYMGWSISGETLFYTAIGIILFIIFLFVIISVQRRKIKQLKDQLKNKDSLDVSMQQWQIRQHKKQLEKEIAEVKLLQENLKWLKKQ